MIAQCSPQVACECLQRLMVGMRYGRAELQHAGCGGGSDQLQDQFLSGDQAWCEILFGGFENLRHRRWHAADKVARSCTSFEPTRTLQSVLRFKYGTDADAELLTQTANPGQALAGEINPSIDARLNLAGNLIIEALFHRPLGPYSIKVKCTSGRLKTVNCTIRTINACALQRR